MKTLLVVLALFVVSLPFVSCCGSTPIPSPDVYVKWTGSTTTDGEQIPEDIETWYSVHAIAVLPDSTEVAYTVSDSVPHEGSLTYQIPWTLPTDDDYYGLVDVFAKLPNGVITQSCQTETVSVFILSQPTDCAIVPRTE